MTKEEGKKAEAAAAGEKPTEKPKAPRDFLEVLRDVASVQASLAPQRQDVCGVLWAELAESIKHELTK